MVSTINPPKTQNVSSSLNHYFSQGQSCTASSRILVQASIYDQFLESFLKKASSHRVGDPFDPEVYSGPQISPQHLDRIMAYVESGTAEGAKLVLGGKRMKRVQRFTTSKSDVEFLEGGNFMEPTVFVDTEPWMKIVKEEIVSLDHLSSAPTNVEHVLSEGVCVFA